MDSNSIVGQNIRICVIGKKIINIKNKKYWSKPNLQVIPTLRDLTYGHFDHVATTCTQHNTQVKFNRHKSKPNNQVEIEENPTRGMKLLHTSM